MQVHTIRKEHPAQTIATMGALPFTKQPTPAEGTDARMQASLLTAETMALIKGQSIQWHAVAWKIIGMTTDGRAAYVKMLDKELAALRESVENHETLNYDEKAARKLVASATTKASECRTIANAFNGSANKEGLAEYFHVSDPENLNFQMILEYARTFNKSAAGRKPDTLLVKLGKWIEVQKKSPEPNAEDQRVMQELLSLYNRLAG